MTDLLAGPSGITRPAVPAAVTRRRVARRRQAIAAAADGHVWAARIAALDEPAYYDPVVAEAVAFDMTCAITDRVSP